MDTIAMHRTDMSRIRIACIFMLQFVWGESVLKRLITTIVMCVRVFCMIFVEHISHKCMVQLRVGVVEQKSVKYYFVYESCILMDG
jgi:hypothetical protein